MTFADTVDLIVSGALWLRSSQLHESGALDIVHRTYRTTVLRATMAGWSCQAGRVLTHRRREWALRGAR
jgi:hypothetical protein